MRTWASASRTTGILEWGTIEGQPPFRRGIDVNLQGSWLGMRTAAPSLRRAGGGVIVNISSLSGITGYAGIGACVASKWGLRGDQGRGTGTGPGRDPCCSVHPGAVRTAVSGSDRRHAHWARESGPGSHAGGTRKLLGPLPLVHRCACGGVVGGVQVVDVVARWGRKPPTSTRAAPCRQRLSRRRQQSAWGGGPS